jgi:oligopeptide transport system substrate-binding protein
MSAFRRARVPGFVIGIVLGAGLLGTVYALVSRSRIEPADFTFVNGAEPSTLDPQAVTGVPEARLMRALFEGLCVLDPRTLAPLPGMAESWEISADELTYTFRVRGGSFWTNGDEVSAFDFAYGFERLLDPRNAAEYGYLLWSVKGAKRFATHVDSSGAPADSFETVGVRAIDARTLVVELERPVPWFLYLAAYHPLSPVNRRALQEMQALYPETWRQERLRPEHLVCNGPWFVRERRINDRIRLAKNARYWDASSVAFDTIDVLASEDLTTNLNLYLTGAAGFVNEVPATSIPALRARGDFQPAAYLATYFYRVNVARPPLDDPRVRRALALAIDREAITRKVTRGGEKPCTSVVPGSIEQVCAYSPPSFRGRDASSFERDVAEARALLASAGFGPGGHAMRPIEIHYNTQSTNKDVAEVVAHSWKQHLGIDAKLVNQEKKVALDTQRRRDYDVSRSTWIADFPDPSTFLEIFTSDNENNRTGWKSARYDELVRRALESRGEERARSYAEAEALVLAELPILPIYEFTVTSLVDPELDGFFQNALDVHFPKFWHWKHSR